MYSESQTPLLTKLIKYIGYMYTHTFITNITDRLNVPTEDNDNPVGTQVIDFK